MALSDGMSLALGGLDLVTGWAESLSQPAPGAGVASVTRVIPGQTWERVILARATFTASAVVGNRGLTARFVDVYNNALWETPIAGPVVASGVVTINLSADVNNALTATGLSIACIPDVVLQSGFGFQLLASGLDVADAWSAMNLYVQRYPTDAVHVGAGG